MSKGLQHFASIALKEESSVNGLMNQNIDASKYRPVYCILVLTKLVAQRGMRKGVLCQLVWGAFARVFTTVKSAVLL